MHCSRFWSGILAMISPGMIAPRSRRELPAPFPRIVPNWERLGIGLIVRLLPNQFRLALFRSRHPWNRESTICDLLAAGAAIWTRSRCLGRCVKWPSRGSV